MFQRFACLVAATLAGTVLAQAGPLPGKIDPATFGAPTFDERWQTLDASEMAKKPPSPTRWRTVLGSGGPTKLEYRSGSAGSIYVDPSFTGVKDDKVLDTPLGLNPFKLDPGKHLTILGSKIPENLQPLAHGKQFMGGVLTTRFSFSQLFGYFEIKAKLPVGKGVWPAFWLMPTKGNWPENGELDIFEGLGVPNEIWCSLHTGEAPKQRNQKVTLPFPVGGPGADWHTYGAAWTADEIVWYVDRKEVRRIPTPSDMKSVPMYILVNLAIGGSWGGYPDASTPMPAEYLIQRVTVWRLPG